MELQQKIDTNTWDHIDDVLKVLELARVGKWAWYGNSRCKYIELRIDMRDGGCILKDREGNRIDVADFAKQAHADGGATWSSVSRVVTGNGRALIESPDDEGDDA